LSEEEGKSDGEKREKGDDQAEKVPLTWRDYVSLFIATLETVLLPFVILVVVLFFFVLLISGHL
jgi:hypothetical protein